MPATTVTQAQILQIVQDLSFNQADANAIPDFFTHVVEDLARFPWLTNVSLLSTIAGTSEYQLSATQVKLLAVFYDNKQLGRLTVKQAESLNPQWRDEAGFPFAYVVEDEPQKTFRLYPNPVTAAKPFIFTNGQPFGLDFPAYAIVIIHTETRTALPAWLALPVALEVMARDFERESNHQDMHFAAVAHQLASLLFSMVA